jgi:hypothetical protein
MGTRPNSLRALQLFRCVFLVEFFKCLLAPHLPLLSALSVDDLVIRSINPTFTQLLPFCVLFLFNFPDLITAFQSFFAVV